ncbi:MAG: Omp28 family outer membrane lipoprotein [Muribaculaceae bacterium]|nr:Omp28 family outer membrane lipoprotein [Muribaculaceae bacterium]
MKKRLSFLTLLLTLVGLSFSSCDSVSEPQRFKPAQIDPQRAILIEEFTGQNCTNCPDGHAAIKELTGALGDSVVPVSIHASSLAMDPPRGYKTATGEEYYKNIGSPALPAAVINRQTSPLQVPVWGSTINSLIMTPTPFTVKASAEVSSDGANYDISVAFSSKQDYEGSLSVWIIENDLVGRQLDHGVNIPDYVHNHVFRAAANGTWGEKVSLKANVPQHTSYSVPIESGWKMANVYVVAFLYDDSGVAQVTSTQSHH